MLRVVTLIDFQKQYAIIFKEISNFYQYLHSNENIDL